MANETLFAECGFTVTSTPNALSLSAKQMYALRADCCSLRERHGASSFFMSLAEAKVLLRDPSRPALLAYVAELLVRELRRMKLPGVRLRSRACGAEFWVQQRRMDAGAAAAAINWHWDKDETLRDACELTVHPLISTVLYLSSGGTPTVVLRAHVTPEGQLRQPVGGGGGSDGELSATVSYPRFGKLLRFDGKLLHGCPAELAEPMGHDGVRGNAKSMTSRCESFTSAVVARVGEEQPLTRRCTPHMASSDKALSALIGLGRAAEKGSAIKGTGQRMASEAIGLETDNKDAAKAMADEAERVTLLVNVW